jgi:hypothetical protein
LKITREKAIFKDFHVQGNLSFPTKNQKNKNNWKQLGISNYPSKQQKGTQVFLPLKVTSPTN